MRAFVSVAALFPAVALGQGGSYGGVVGGYSDAVAGANATALLTKALATDALYGSAVTTRICFSTITSLQTQVVSGTNYKYTVNACPVSSAQDGQGKCPSAVLSSCTPRAYVVTIYEQVWTNTTQISSIQSDSSAGSVTKNSAVVAAASSIAVAAFAFLGAFM